MWVQGPLGPRVDEARLGWQLGHQERAVWPMLTVLGDL